MQFMWWKAASFFAAFLFTCHPLTVICAKVAIVGAGVGGSAVAYFVNELTQNTPKSSSVSVYLYEKSERIGGRVYATHFTGKKFEAGASIIHSRNKYASSLLKKLKLSKKKKPSKYPDNVGTLTGIFDGKSCVFKESHNDLFTLLKFASHFGLGYIKMFASIISMLDAFDMVYIRHSRGHAFTTLQDMLLAMDHSFINMTKVTAYEYFTKHLSLDATITEQLINAATLVNYGQSITTLPAFVASVALAGADFTSELWSVEGGNELLAQTMANESTANVLLNRQVVKVTRNSNNNTYTLTDNLGGKRIVDVVVIAHPLAMSTINFDNFDDLFMREINLERSKKYHTTIATFICGQRKEQDAYCSTSDVLICKDNYQFQSVGFNSPVNYTFDESQKEEEEENCSVYKMFSPQQLTSQVIDSLFNEVKHKQIVHWKAYPEYKVGQVTRAGGPVFQLEEGVYYVNAIEWAASAIEMSLIGAKNVALLTAKYLHRKGLLNDLESWNSSWFSTF